MAQQNYSFKIKAINRGHEDFPADINSVEAQQWVEPFHFVQAADTQFGLIDRYIKEADGILDQEPDWQVEIDLTRAVIRACNKLEPKPKFLVICGDLVDAWPGTGTRRKQVLDLKKVLCDLDSTIPLVCICGNHDIGDQPTLSSIDEYKKDFGDDYFCFAKGGVLFIVINSQFYEHRSNLEEYAREHDEWLENTLSKCKNFKHSIVFEHIPWFLNDPEEEDVYFNINKDLRLVWLKKFKDAGVSKIFCGHYHRNGGGFFEGLEQVVTSAIGRQFGDDKSGVRIVKVLDSSIVHQYYSIEDIPTKVSL